MGNIRETGFNVTAKCRNEPEGPFDAKVMVYIDGRLYIDCSHCLRRYFQNPDNLKFECEGGRFLNILRVRFEVPE